mgnify:CR=1 FL=1
MRTSPHSLAKPHLLALVVLLLGVSQLLAAALPLRKWAQELPIPATAVPARYDADGIPEYDIFIRETKAFVHPDLQAANQPTTFWAYNGQVPGPTIDVVQGQPIKVNFINSLTSGNGATTCTSHFFRVEPPVASMSPVSVSCTGWMPQKPGMLRSSLRTPDARRKQQYQKAGRPIVTTMCADLPVRPFGGNRQLSLPAAGSTAADGDDQHRATRPPQYAVGCAA